MVNSFTTVAVASLISAAAASSLEVRQAGSSQCSNLHVMVAGGCHSPCTMDGLGLLSTTVAGITNEIAGSDLYLVPYNGAAKQAAVSGPLLNQAIAQYTAQCPDTPIVLVGYSLGGIITTNSLCGQVPYTPNIIASITYGEETFAYPTSYDRGTCRENAPLYARTNTAACAPFAPIIRSYCDALDPNCCASGNQDNNAAHFQYPGKYDAEVAAYVLSQYNAYTATFGTSSTPTEGSMTTTSMGMMTTAAAGGVIGAPFGNNTVAMSTMSNGNVVVGGNGGMGGNSVITQQVTVTGTTTISLFEATGLSTPVNPTGTAVPNSVAYESAAAPTGPAAPIVAVGTGSGIVIAPSLVPTAVVGPIAPVGTGGMMGNGTNLTPFNPNGASSLAISGSLAAAALLAAAMVL